MTEIKPCPKCGGKAEYFINPLSSRHFVRCLGCFKRTAIYDTSEEAILAWNEEATSPTDGSRDRRVNANPVFCCKGLFDVLLHRQDVCILDGKFLTIRGLDIWDTPIKYCPSCGKEIRLTFLADPEVDE